jgi:tetratricopeptide (TPR) repeat protein
LRQLLVVGMTLSRSHTVYLMVITVFFAALPEGKHPVADDRSSGDQMPVSPPPATTNAPAFATTIDNQVNLPMDTNLLAETERNYRRALAIDEKSLGPEHALVANRIIDLAVLLHKTNRLAEAEPLYRRALEINEKNLGSEHPMVAVALNNLAMLLLATNRFAEAEPLMRRALAIDERNLGPDDMSVAVRLNNLALLLQSTRRLAEAELLYQRALAIREKNFDPNHPSVGIALTNLALLLKATNRFAEAESLLRRASTLGQKHNINRPGEPASAEPAITPRLDSTHNASLKRPEADRAAQFANAANPPPVIGAMGIVVVAALAASVAWLFAAITVDVWRARSAPKSGRRSL